MESFSHPTSLDSARGFTLVEMLVVLAIITIVTSIVLFGQGTFNRSISLTDTAYTVALSIREAQSLGLSSRIFSGVQNAGYGTHFARGSNSYIMFVDTQKPASNPAPATCLVSSGSTPDTKPGNCLYDSITSPDAIFQTATIGKGFTIKRFCGTLSSGGTKVCSDDSTPIDTLDIVYVRPNPESVMTATRGATQLILSRASIYIASPDGMASRGICVSLPGQVSVVTGTCP